MYYICALYDDGRQGGFPQLFTTDTTALEQFAERWDRPGMSVYQCVSTLQPGAQRRSRDTVAELTTLHVDIDLRMLTTTPEVVRQKLLELSLSLPVEIRNSGGGYHVLVELKEPVRAGTPEFERANALRGALTRMLCGDPAPDHHAALLRRVGTHNTKYGEARLCQVEKAGAPVDITDLEAFIELYDGKPQFEWAPKLSGHAQKPEREERERENGFDDSPCAELNTAALRNLPAWVPELLPDAKRRSGRYAAYDAVNPSRPSSTGRPYEQRKRNLGIVGSGIKDFGTGKGYSPLDLVMAVRGSSLAEAFCWLEEKLLPQKSDIEIDLDKIIEAQGSPSIMSDAGDDDGHGGDEQPKETPKRRRINPMPLILPRERDVPRRQFLYGMHYMRGTVSGTIGTGGTGKSTLGLIEGIGMSVARDLLGGEKFKAPLRVWYHNAEETMEELTRRCVAICKHFNVSAEEFEKNFLVTNGFETPIKVANGGRDVKIDAALRKEIIDVIAELKIDVVIFDPLVAMHRVHEDFNSALDPVIRDAFCKIAHDTNCSIDLCHHTRKKAAGQDSEYTVADSRGGQSFIDAVRGARVLNTMSKSEATNFDLSEESRFDYMRLSRGKANMVRRGIIVGISLRRLILTTAVRRRASRATR